MSIEYCFYCDKHIDTDFNAEHFILNEKGDKIISCVQEQEDQEIFLLEVASNIPIESKRKFKSSYDVLEDDI